jgi:hypothetical protein
MYTFELKCLYGVNTLQEEWRDGSIFKLLSGSTGVEIKYLFICLDCTWYPLTKEASHNVHFKLVQIFLQN